MPSHLPRALRDRAFDIPRVLPIATAYDWGMTRSGVAHAMSTRGWQRLTRGILLTVPGPPTRADWIDVGLELAGPTGALSGWDAVRIDGLGAATPPRPEVLVLCRTGKNRQVAGVRIRLTARPFRTWMLPAEHPTMPFVPVVHTARAVADTALQYRRLAPVRALVTSAVQTRRCQVEELIAEVDTGPRNYSGLLRRAVADLRDGARSVAEAEAIEILRRSPVPVFDANVAIVTASGVEIAVVDVLWRELRAVIEIDSRQFHFSEEDWTNTMSRHNRLTTYGLAIEHCPPSEVRTRKLAWAKDVELWLRARARELGVPYDVPRNRPPAELHPRPFLVPGLGR
jgi:hypothetical protein